MVFADGGVYSDGGITKAPTVVHVLVPIAVHFCARTDLGVPSLLIRSEVHDVDVDNAMLIGLIRHIQKDMAARAIYTRDKSGALVISSMRAWMSPRG